MEPTTEPSAMHAALPARALETGVSEYLADDEPARLFGAHLTGQGRHRGQNANQQRNRTQHATTPTDATK